MAHDLIAEFADAEALRRGILTLRSHGYRRLEAFLPVPDEGVEDALALPQAKLSLWASVGGCVGGVSAYTVQWWTNAVDFPLHVGGFAPHAPLAFLPIVFETSILFAVLGACAGFVVATGLPQWWHPVFGAQGFERVTRDRYFLLLSHQDPSFDPATTDAHLRALQPLSLQPVPP